MAFGLLYPRRRRAFDGDRENKYRTYGMVQRLHDRYVAEYGGITCQAVHRAIFGRPYNLRDPKDREAFEAAGAHEDKCTGVVQRTAEWAMEIIGEERFLRWGGMGPTQIRSLDSRRRPAPLRRS